MYVKSVDQHIFHILLGIDTSYVRYKYFLTQIVLSFKAFSITPGCFLVITLNIQKNLF